MTGRAVPQGGRSRPLCPQRVLATLGLAVTFAAGPVGLVGPWPQMALAQAQERPPPRPVRPGEAGAGDPGAAPERPRVAVQDTGAVASAPGAVLRGLDKMTGTTRDIDLRVGDTTEFGRLTVSLADCRYPIADPGANAFAQVIILDPAMPDPLFYGWMVATSPALSALDHPRYDIWVLRCIMS